MYNEINCGSSFIKSTDFFSVSGELASSDQVGIAKDGVYQPRTRWGRMGGGHRALESHATELINKTDPHRRRTALNNVSRPKTKVNKSESKN